MDCEEKREYGGGEGKVCVGSKRKQLKHGNEGGREMKKNPICVKGKAELCVGKEEKPNWMLLRREQITSRDGK